MTKGHDFQEAQRPRDYTAGDISSPFRDIQSRAFHKYRGVPAEIAQSADPALDPNAPGIPGSGINAGNLSQFQLLIRATMGMVDFQQLFFDYDATPQLILPASSRTYILIQNLDAAAFMYIGFGVQPDAANVQGVEVAPKFYYEQAQRIPQGDIWITGTAGGKCTVVYANALI